MPPPDAAAMRREILDEVGALLREHFAADAWGRILVEVVAGRAGESVVAGVDVEEIVGDEARVDEVFGGDAARALMPALARATEALCACEGVELGDVGGGTFVRLEKGFAWLPGLVRAPSLRLDRERDALVARLKSNNEKLHARFKARGVTLDVEAEELRWTSDSGTVGTARATLIGTFAHGTRTWAWASHNPSLSERARRAAAELTDALAERDLWEISTPAFATDEATAWALAALVCDRASADGVQRIARDEGALLVLVREARQRL